MEIEFWHFLSLVKILNLHPSTTEEMIAKRNLTGINDRALKR
jgi:hypothetical protein